MMKKYLIVVLLIIGVFTDVNAQKTKEIFTIYLVRHAEKNLSVNPSDPPLTECGEQRAESLNVFFEEVALDAIYSTDYTRTKSTATPTALAKEIQIQLYDASKLEDFSKLLIDLKEDALVVGHSNTTAVLAGLLIGEDLGTFEESIYNRVYQVVFNKCTGRLQLFQTAFSCDN